MFYDYVVIESKSEKFVSSISTDNTCKFKHVNKKWNTQKYRKRGT